MRNLALIDERISVQLMRRANVFSSFNDFCYMMFIVGCGRDGFCEHGDKSSAPQAHPWICTKHSKTSSVTIFLPKRFSLRSQILFSLDVSFAKLFFTNFSQKLVFHTFFPSVFVSSWTLYPNHSCLAYLYSVSCHVTACLNTSFYFQVWFPVISLVWFQCAGHLVYILYFH